MEKNNVKMARCFTLQNLCHISSKELSAARCIGVTASSSEAVGSGCALHLKSPRTPSMRHSSNASSFNKTNILRWTFKQLPQKHKTNISKIHISLWTVELKHRNASIKCMSLRQLSQKVNSKENLQLHTPQCSAAFQIVPPCCQVQWRESKNVCLIWICTFCNVLILGWLLRSAQEDKKVTRHP